jgi:hypothetical protein
VIFATWEIFKKVEFMGMKEGGMVTPVMASLFKWQCNCLQLTPSNVSQLRHFFIITEFFGLYHSSGIFQRTLNNILFSIPDDGQRKKEKVITSVKGHRQNPLESTSSFLFAHVKQLLNSFTDFTKISYCEIKIAVFFFVVPCSFEDWYRSFVGICCLKMVAVCSTEALLSAHKNYTAIQNLLLQS